MPNSNPSAALPTVHADLVEIALRANRLHELVELGELYQQVDRSYRPLQRQGTAAKVRFADFLDRWGNWKRDLEVLYGVVPNTHHIRQSLETDIAPAVGAAVDELTGQLKTLCTKVDAACQLESPPELSAAVSQVDMALRRHLAVHKVFVDREVDRLCRLTEKLRDQLQTP